MFSFLQGSDDLLIQILSNPCQQNEISKDPQNVDNNSNSQKKKRKLGTSNNDETGTIIPPPPPDDDDNFKLRRIMHRDIERQRRREMSTLYSSLRSLLPLHYVKGKRSVSDHMHEAVNYIKEMQGNMKELEKQRDLLIKSNSSIIHGITENGSKSNSFTVSKDCVTVNPCQGTGIQILISVDCDGKCFPLSRLLRRIMKEGLDIVSYVSAKANQRSLYTIQTEACDINKIDHVALQQKVIDMINLDL